jgi:hypothetical protein
MLPKQFNIMDIKKKLPKHLQFEDNSFWFDTLITRVTDSPYVKGIYHPHLQG